MPCPVCQGATSRLSRKHEYWIRACQGCSHQYAEILPAKNHVESIYSDEYFQDGGAGYNDYLSEAPLLRAHGQRYGRLLARYMEPGTVLDVGAAAGFIMQGLVDTGWRGAGIEPNPRMAEYARTQLNLPVKTGTFEQFQTSECYDLVSMIQVIAHFVDLRKVFQVAASVVRPGGFLLVETWNRGSWTAWIFGTQWHEYSPPSVLHWFTPESLRRLLGQFNFHEITCSRPAKRISGAHAKSLLHYTVKDAPLGRLVTRMASVVPDHLLIPYPAEDLFWMLFQKSAKPS